MFPAVKVLTLVYQMVREDQLERGQPGDPSTACLLNVRLTSIVVEDANQLTTLDLPVNVQRDHESWYPNMSNSSKKNIFFQRDL